LFKLKNILGNLQTERKIMIISVHFSNHNIVGSLSMAEDKQDLQPLLEIDPALAQYLEIVKGDLLLEGDFDEHVKGCHGVFHLACPTNFVVEDPQVSVVVHSYIDCYSFRFIDR
jgi:bifunctional dihydroflavonol 4-reductase/flavanone 4-reductase